MAERRFKKWRGVPLSLRASGGSFADAFGTSGTSECASLGLAARTPGHERERFVEIDRLPIVEGPKDPGIKCAYKAPASRDKAFHSAADGRMFVSAEINAVIPSTARDVMDLWYSHWQ